MQLQSWLEIGFEYGLWANSMWIDHLGNFRSPEKATQVLDHILTAERIWLIRCGQDAPPADENETAQAVATRLSNQWQHLIRSTPLDTLIDYRNVAGEPFQNQLGEIALHVINHGTYHRGHLRGLADAEGLEAFEDTDLIKYFRQEKGLSVF